MDYIFTLSVLKVLTFVLVLFIYLTSFFKYDIVYKLITLYVFFNTCFKITLFFIQEKDFLNSTYLVLQIYLFLAIYYVLLKKKKYIIYVAFGNLLLVTLLLLTKKPRVNIMIAEMIITYLALIIFSNIHHFNRLKKEKYYYYFNTGMFFFVLLSSICFIIFFSAFIITQNEIYNKMIIVSLNLLEIFLCYFLIKEKWKLKKIRG